jgi:hypothetical protein
MNRIRPNSENWLMAELHAHCSLDPMDYRLCNYSPERLISEAARLGYRVLAVTCHDRDIWSEKLSEYAEELGITLVPGMEVSVEGGRHVLAYNFRTGAENLNTLAKLRARKREDTVVIAPHPFFPARSCLRKLLPVNQDLFDAIEISGFYTARLDFNRRARRIAAEYGKPLVGNGDVHLLWQLGRTFTWINAEPGVEPVLQAIKQGRMVVESAPLSLSQVARWWTTALLRYAFPVNKKPRARPIITSSESLIEN